MNDKSIESWRARAAVSEALDVFNSSYMQEVWSKALARRVAEPDAAVTLARTLLESVCKHILDSAEKPYRDGIPLKQLYDLTAEVLEIAPTEQTVPIFQELLKACAEIINGVGSLRNYLSDAHGRRPFGTTPDWRHAELAVNLSGAMATYLAALWQGRQPTIADAIGSYIARAEETKPLGSSHRWALERLAKDKRICDLIASQLKVSDLVSFGVDRRNEGAAPATVNGDITYLSSALGDSHAYVIDQARQALRTMRVIDKSQARKRRPTHEEIDALIKYFKTQDLDPATKVRMADVTEFAAWSGRWINEICSLRWADVDFEERTCRLPGKKESFPVLERAWEIIEARKNHKEDEVRIFPYKSTSCSQRYIDAKRKLAITIPALKDLVFNDYRREAVSRLLEHKHQPHEVARATGQDIKKVMQTFDEMRKGIGFGE